MARTLSSALKTEAEAQNQTDALLALVKIEQADISTLYLVKNGENVTSNSQVYTAFPFDIKIPDDNEESAPRVTVTFDNVDQSIVTNIRSMTTEATVTLSFVLASQPDTVDLGPYVFQLKNVRYDRFTVEGDLSYKDVFNMRFPADRITPNNFPCIVR
jgi:hypothetical protein